MIEKADFLKYLYSNRKFDNIKILNYCGLKSERVNYLDFLSK